MAKLNFSLSGLLILIAAGLLVISYSTPVEADCGLGCHRSMGSCSVNESLWAAAQNALSQGYRLTSCCRTPAYNRQLKMCGYPVATNSAHMSGNAVDVKFPPGKCNARSLEYYGFHNVCPLYHFNHCHISTCGNARSYDRARATTRRQVNEVRSRNARKVYGRHALSRRHHGHGSSRGAR